MERKLVIIILLILTMAGVHAQNCNIKLTIGEIKEAKGKLIISLFDNEKDFLEKPVKNYSLDVKKVGKIEHCIKGISAGKYAIAIIHDIDNNGELNSRLYGPPSEPYGFSRNARGFMGPAKYEDAVFDLNPDKPISFNIKLE